MLRINSLFSIRPTFLFHTLPLHDALPISGTITTRGRGCTLTRALPSAVSSAICRSPTRRPAARASSPRRRRSEEHTSELQSRGHLVCRLLLEQTNHHLHVTNSKNQTERIV